jgi:hypothetical protein
MFISVNTASNRSLLQLGLLSLKGIEHINCCLCHVSAPMLCAKRRKFMRCTRSRLLRVPAADGTMLEFPLSGGSYLSAADFGATNSA